MNDYRTEAPPILRDFLSYHETIKAHSRKTVDEYFLDLRNFFRYLKQTRDPSLRGLELNEISILDIDLDFVSSVTLTDIYGYMTYLSRERVLHQNSDASGYGLNAASRARKIATIRSFYKYLTNKVHLIKEIRSRTSIRRSSRKRCRNTSPWKKACSCCPRWTDRTASGITAS